MQETNRACEEMHLREGLIARDVTLMCAGITGLKRRYENKASCLRILNPRSQQLMNPATVCKPAVWSPRLVGNLGPTSRSLARLKTAWAYLLAAPDMAFVFWSS